MTTAIDMQSVDNQRIVEQIVRREVHHCVSALVYHFYRNPGALKGSEYTFEDDVLPLCSQDDWEGAVDDYTSSMSRKDCVEYLDLRSLPVDFGDDEISIFRGYVFKSAKEEGIRDFAEDYRIDPYQVEALEHWIVSDFAAQRLSALGEMTGELFGLTIWGRCGTGQAIHLDSVWCEIAKEMMPTPN